MNIWIMDSKSGIKLLYKSFLKTDIDEDLVSGLLSAFNKFAMTEFHQPIESLELSGFRWVYLSDSEYNLLFVAADNRNETTEKLRSKLNIIKDAFINQYKEEFVKRDNTWDGDKNLFLDFIDVIDNYFYEWAEAEIVTILADVFNLIAVIQSLLNRVFKIIQEKITGAQQEYVFQKFEEVIEDFKNDKEMKDDIELKKINFSREKGFSVSDVNPSNCDPIVVKRSLIKIIEKVVIAIKERLGEDISLNLFRKGKILTYIFNNMSFLKELDLDVFLLKLFLFL
ncbi:MAG TPA: hypothetical protein VGB37_17880 [Candidatus Lokiarchaeia archaeon]